MATLKAPQARIAALQKWHRIGGVMIIGYEMYRNLSQGCNIKNEEFKKILKSTLVDPGKLTVKCHDE